MKLLGKIPDKVYLACSGGKDSMAILNFLLQGKKDVHVLYFNHSTLHGKEAEHFVHEFCRQNKLHLDIGTYFEKENTEEAWREARYKFFSFYKDRPIITGHHLLDNIETWLMSSITGTSKFIPYSRDNIIRPFLLTSRFEIDSYTLRYNLSWIEDPSNSENNYSRNKLRNLVLPVLKEINPGLEKTFKFKCIEKYTKEGLL